MEMPTNTVHPLEALVRLRVRTDLSNPDDMLHATLEIAQQFPSDYDAHLVAASAALVAHRFDVAIIEAALAIVIDTRAKAAYKALSNALVSAGRSEYALVVDEIERTVVPRSVKEWRTKRAAR